MSYKKPFAWSWSALQGWNTCPRQHYEMKIKKAWPDPPGEVQQWGITVHKLIEDRLTMGKALPTYLNYVEPIIQKLENTKGTVQAEYKLALNKSLKPVEFFDKSAWVRAVGDVVKIHEDRALQVDWKAGRFREGEGQLKLQSAVLMATYPHVQKVGVVYAWLKDKRTTVRTYSRGDLLDIWQEFLPQVTAMEKGIEAGDFPPRPSGLCGRYCAVLSCEHNGRNK